MTVFIKQLTKNCRRLPQKYALTVDRCNFMGTGAVSSLFGVELQIFDFSYQQICDCIHCQLNVGKLLAWSLNSIFFQKMPLGLGQVAATSETLFQLTFSSFNCQQLTHFIKSSNDVTQQPETTSTLMYSSNWRKADNDSVVWLRVQLLNITWHKRYITATKTNNMINFLWHMKLTAKEIWDQNSRSLSIQATKG